MALKGKLKVTDLNPHLSCILCGGYYIDATSITQCLHSFCRACIVRYVESSRFCPVCEVQIHKTRPLRCLRPDKSLQDLVYKIIPGLFQNEMKRRRELYASQPPEALEGSRDEEDRGDIPEDRFIYSPNEMFSISLKYRTNNQDESIDPPEEITSTDKEEICRYLKCPAALKIHHLKKFLRCKYNIPKKFLIIMEHSLEPLNDEYSLMDIGYIYDWKRKDPLELTFRIFDRTMIRLAMQHELGKSSHESEKHQDDTEMENSDESKQKIEDFVPKNECSPKSDQVISKTDVKSEIDSSEELRSLSSKVSVDTETVNGLPEEKACTVEKCEETAVVEPEKDESRLDQSPIIQLDLQNEDYNIKKDENGDIPVPSCTKRSLSTEDAETSLLKVPKLTIPLTPKIIKQAAQHAKEDKMDIDNDLFEGRLVIAEPEDSPKRDDSKGTLLEAKDPMDITVDRSQQDDDEIDSGRGSDICSRTDVPSLSGDDELRSPVSITVCSPDSEKPVQPNYPDTLPYAINKDVSNADFDRKTVETEDAAAACSSKDNFGPLDLSMGSRKESEMTPMIRPRHVANPAPATTKPRPQSATYLSVPKHPSFKLLPAILPHTSIYKKPEYARGNFRYNRGSTLKVFNPDPNGGRTKIVIKNIDPRPEDNRHHHHRIL